MLQQKCPLQRKAWIGVKEMWNLIRTKGYLSQTQNLLQSVEAGEKNWFQQWQDISLLTNDSNGQKRQYPDPKESAGLHLMAWRWRKIILAWVQIHILWLFKFILWHYSIPVMCFWNWKIILFSLWVQPCHRILWHGGGSQNSSQTSSLGVWFDD